MAVIKEYVCFAHGDFESTEERCPHGCTGRQMVQRVFRTAPAIQSARFRGANKTIQSLAEDFGLSDINQRGGDGGRRSTAQDIRNRERALEEAGMRPGGGFDLTPRFAPMGSAPLGSAPSTIVVDPGTHRPAISNGQSIVGALPKPKPIVQGRFDGTKLGTPGS